MVFLNNLTRGIYNTLQNHDIKIHCKLKPQDMYTVYNIRERVVLSMQVCMQVLSMCFVFATHSVTPTIKHTNDMTP